MNIYIQSAAQISIQKPLCEEWFDAPIYYQEKQVRAIDPDYKKFLDPMASRRMGHVLKRALTTSIAATEGTDKAQLDAIITGTGLGCIENTEKFLTPMVKDGEALLTPTFFMQSTHNTISSQVALNFKCHGYNCTYSHRGSSFENALMDAYEQFILGKINTALIGGHDELTPAYFELLDKIEYWKNGEINDDIIRKGDSAGSFAGETAISILLNKEKKENSLCELKGMDILYKPTSQRLQKCLNDLLSANGLQTSDIDAVVCGYNGDKENDSVYKKNLEELLPGTQQLIYKHLFGESYTMSGIGIYVGATCLHKKRIPECLVYKNRNNNKPKTILVYSHSQNKDHSLILLSSC